MIHESKEVREWVEETVGYMIHESRRLMHKDIEDSVWFKRYQSGVISAEEAHIKAWLDGYIGTFDADYEEGKDVCTAYPIAKSNHLSMIKEQVKTRVTMTWLEEPEVQGKRILFTAHRASDDSLIKQVYITEQQAYNYSHEAFKLLMAEDDYTVTFTHDGGIREF